MKTIILIGDSIRMGYSPFVRSELEGEAIITEPQENGYASNNVLAHLEEWVLAPEADIVHINCGLHDLARNAGDNSVRVELDEYETNLREILTRIQRSGKSVLWATITPVNEANHRVAKGWERREADIEKYNEVASRVASELNIPINDLNRVVQQAGPDRVLLPDGVHYGESGSAILGAAVAEFLRAYL